MLAHSLLPRRDAPGVCEVASCLLALLREERSAERRSGLRDFSPTEPSDRPTDTSRESAAGPEQHVRLAPDVLENPAEVFQPVRRAHDVGVHDQRHHPRAALGIGVDLLELIHRAVVVFRRLVMLDQHHRHVVAFLGVGNVDDRLAPRLQPHRLVVQHPVGDVVVAVFLQEIRRLPGFGQAGPEPAARRLAGRLFDRLCGQVDVGLLVRHLLHVALGEAVADELPVALVRRLHDRRIGLDGAAVDRQHAGNGELVEHLEHPPEADAVAVFVPAPVRNVGRRRAAGRRRQHRARHHVLRVPVLDIDDHPDRHARAAGELQRRPLGNGRIGDAIGRQHSPRCGAGLVCGVIHGGMSSCICFWRMLAQTFAGANTSGACAGPAAGDQCNSRTPRTPDFA